MKALSIVEKLDRSNIGNCEKLQAFHASAGFISRFKSRHNLVSRCITSERTFLELAPQKTNEFTLFVQVMIEKIKIKEKNIFNLE